MSDRSIDFPRINPRANISADKYKKQLAWRQEKVRELLARGYSQKEISSTLHISQTTVSRDLSFIRSVLQQDCDTDNIKKKFSEDIALAKMGFDEIKKNLWEIVDDKRTKDRMRLKALKQLAQVTVQSLELIPMAEILNRIEMMNKDLRDRYTLVLE
ncbi:MAG: ECF-type sigma factor [Candidatus Nitrosocosmicus sp.]